MKYNECFRKRLTLTLPHVPTPRPARAPPPGDEPIMKGSRLVWFRGKDLRIADHAPLYDAVKEGPFVAVFVLDPFFFAPERARELPNRMQFLLESLDALQKNFTQLGGELVTITGRSVDVIPEVARRLRVGRVVAHRMSEPFTRLCDQVISSRLDIPFELYEGETLLPPSAVMTGSGTPYSVFTPFYRAARQKLAVAAPLRRPASLASSLDPSPIGPLRAPIPTLKDLGLERNPRLLRGGERAGRERLRTFVETGLNGYETARDLLSVPGTSRLSVDLKFGTVSVRTVWRSLARRPESSSRARFEAELFWREFALVTLWHRPELLKVPFRQDFRGFPYENDERLWFAWRSGATGYPIVDAAQRQLLLEGFIPNRARMISASFLTKNLLTDHRHGERHYLKHLTDGDYAANNMGWQWSAGSGVDAAPYFRVFNPVTQGKKLDPEGEYVRRYVPELARLPARYIHAPFEAPRSVLEAAGVQLGRNYPRPVVDLRASRARFLSVAMTHLRQSATPEKNELSREKGALTPVRLPSKGRGFV